VSGRRGTVQDRTTPPNSRSRELLLVGLGGFGCEVVVGQQESHAQHVHAHEGEDAPLQGHGQLTDLEGQLRQLYQGVQHLGVKEWESEKVGKWGLSSVALLRSWSNL
jgi:hypothetical protein